MSYIQKNLLKNEKVIYFTHIHWIVFGIPAFLMLFAFVMSIYGPHIFRFAIPLTQFSLASVVTFFLLMLAVVTFLDALIQYLTSEYGITNKRILIKTGWIRRNSLELFIDKVEAIYVDQGILGRILNYGILRVVGTGGTQDPFFYVPDPLRFRKIAQEQVDIEEQSRKF